MSLNIFYLFANPIISRGPGGDGLKTHLSETVRAFERLEHNVVQLPSNDNNRNGDQESGALGRVKEFLPNKFRCVGRDAVYLMKNHKFSNEVNAILKNGSIDLIYERYYIFQFAGLRAAKRFNIPIILEINSPLYEAKESSGLGLGFLAQMMEKRIARSVDALVVVSSVVRDYLVQMGINSKKIHVIPNGVDLEKFNPNISGYNVRKKYKLEGKTIVGFVGSFNFYHGTDIFIEVAEEIVREYDNISFLIVGGQNEQFQNSFKYIQERSLDKRIVLTGKIPYESIPEYIAAMDITVLPAATNYGFPIKLCEYGGMGKPIVAPRVKPVEEIFENGKMALLFNLGNRVSLKNTIIQLIQNASLRDDMGTRVYEHVRTDYTWDRNAEKIIAIYESLQ